MVYVYRVANSLLIVEADGVIEANCRAQACAGGSDWSIHTPVPELVCQGDLLSVTNSYQAPTVCEVR